jgi:hypothetical protein
LKRVHLQTLAIHFAQVLRLSGRAARTDAAVEHGGLLLSFKGREEGKAELQANSIQRPQAGQYGVPPSAICLYER